MRIRITVLAAALLLVLVAACQEPSDAARPGSSAAPGGVSPIAPAIEPEPTGPERSIELPSDAPIAPAIEPEPTGPDPTIGFDGY